MTIDTQRWSTRENVESARESVEPSDAEESLRLAGARIPDAKLTITPTRSPLQSEPASAEITPLERLLSAPIDELLCDVDTDALVQYLSASSPPPTAALSEDTRDELLCDVDTDSQRCQVARIAAGAATVPGLDEVKVQPLGGEFGAAVRLAQGRAAGHGGDGLQRPAGGDPEATQAVRDALVKYVGASVTPPLSEDTRLRFKSESDQARTVSGKGIVEYVVVSDARLGFATMMRSAALSLGALVCGGVVGLLATLFYQDLAAVMHKIVVFLLP